MLKNGIVRAKDRASSLITAFTISCLNLLCNIVAVYFTELQGAVSHLSVAIVVRKCSRLPFW